MIPVEYTIVNLVTFLLGIGFLLSGYRLVRTGREDVALFLMSSFIGVGLIVVAIFPDLFGYIATFLGIKFKTNAILIVSNLTLFVLVTYLFNRIGRLYDNISRLNEELSLLRIQVERSDED